MRSSASMTQGQCCALRVRLHVDRELCLSLHNEPGYSGFIKAGEPMRALVVLVLVACGGGEEAVTHQLDASSIDASDSICGNPGDIGNELGIGKYCASLFDCSDTPSAPLCSSLGDPNTHFCTKTCPKGSTDQCGIGA